MDNKIYDFFLESLTIDLIDMIISNSSDKGSISKIKIRPVIIKEVLRFQISEYRGKQIFHKNYERQEVLELLPGWFEMEAVTRFKQVEARMKYRQSSLLISKKGTVTIKSREMKSTQEQRLEHNRKKEYILPDDEVVPFLVDLGVQTPEGKIITKRYDKFKQINRFLEFIEDILPELPNTREVNIVDFGCGKSYLTFAMYYYLREIKKYAVRIIGLDLKEEVIKSCNELSQKYGYEGLTFQKGDIADYESKFPVDMVVSLHACDTATDYALYKGIKWNAKVILSVPCCQHEANNQMQASALQSLFQYGLIKERTAALFTDAIRANILEEQGYKVQILEFIDMEHTPKNILIRGIKMGKKGCVNYKEAKEFLGIHLTLEQLLTEEKPKNI